MIRTAALIALLALNASSVAAAHDPCDVYEGCVLDPSPPAPDEHRCLVMYHGYDVNLIVARAYCGTNETARSEYQSMGANSRPARAYAYQWEYEDEDEAFREVRVVQGSDVTGSFQSAHATVSVDEDGSVACEARASRGGFSHTTPCPSANPPSHVCAAYVGCAFNEESNSGGDCRKGEDGRQRTTVGANTHFVDAAVNDACRQENGTHSESNNAQVAVAPTIAGVHAYAAHRNGTLPGGSFEATHAGVSVRPVNGPHMDAGFHRHDGPPDDYCTIVVNVPGNREYVSCETHLP